MLLKKQQLNPTKLIALGYCAIILIGAVLLTLPISSKNGVMTPFIDALFTAATSTCVTGLVVYDTLIVDYSFGSTSCPVICSVY